MRISGASRLDRLDELSADLVTAVDDDFMVARVHTGFVQRTAGYRLEHYAAAHRRLADSEITDQSEVDRIFGIRPTRPKTTPKGVSPETAEVVEQALRNSDQPLSASECAELVGISRVTARRYLEHFVATGQAQVALKYGSAGRPERRYHWQLP